ncbi:uncharacterized protein LOC110024773 [Phalaenopsis equestris]|uniref:uncharacterized protein LOC110024773 n=1 Tax=Phalaenopsis equestris TaxID=78828 RepID=UPI0009E59487|nr:uncharacterized protein LOC110024773 [Phalaenopsis equestris]
MGCRYSIEEASVPFIGVRVININGVVELFELPVAAGEVTGNPSSHVLCSAAHLLSPGAQPLRPDDRLESGRLYFLLPSYALQAGPLDLAALATRLTNLARTAQVRKAKVESGAPGAGSVPAGVDQGKVRIRPRPHVWRAGLSGGRFCQPCGRFLCLNPWVRNL